MEKGARQRNQPKKLGRKAPTFMGEGGEAAKPGKEPAKAGAKRERMFRMIRFPWMV